MPRIISIVNHKGGVGKTTTTLNLGKALSLQGYRTLLVDLDPQANLTQSIEPDPLNDGPVPVTITHCLAEQAALPCLAISENLWLAPADSELRTAELKLQSEPVNGILRLKAAFKPVADKFDFILIDCPPSLGLLTTNAVIAATEILIVLHNYLSLHGLNDVLTLVGDVRENFNPKLRITGILITMVNRTVVTNAIIDQVREAYGDQMFRTTVRSAAVVVEASTRRQDLFDYAPKAPVTEDYAALAQEVLSRHG
jgi:chromosome partitioning protein